MADERFAQILDPPEDPDQSDGGQWYSLGVRFGPPSQAGGSCYAVDWLCPTNAPTGNQQGALYNLAGSQLQISPASAATPGIINRYTYGSPQLLSVGSEYVACILTNRYAFTSAAAPGPDPFPATSSPGGYLSAPTQNGRLGTTTAGVMVFPNLVSASNSSFHVSPVVDYAVGAANGVLNITLPSLLAPLNAQLPIVSSLGIVLPGAGLLLGAQAIANGGLSIVLPSLGVSGTGGSLPRSLRDYIWTLLASDAQLNGLGITSANLFGAGAADSPAANMRVWVILHWGVSEPPPGRDTTSRKRTLTVWAYDREGDYSRIEPILSRIQKVLLPIKGVQHSLGGWVTQVDDSGFGEDLYDPGYLAQTKSWNTTIVASGD